MGELCLIGSERRGRTMAEVVGFRENRTLLMPFGELTGVRPGDEVVATGRQLTAPVGEAVLGRVLDGIGRPIDGGPTLDGVRTARRPVSAAAPNALAREPIRQRLGLGVRAIDACIPCGRGQRLGIFAGSGVGKSTLLGMITRQTRRRRGRRRTRRRARSRGARVPRERDLGRAAARARRGRRDRRPARARRVKVRGDGDGDRRGLPRPGQGRAPADGLGDALRDGAARDRPRDRRAAGVAGLHAVRVRARCRGCSSAPARPSAARSPRSSPCSSRATT